MTRCYINLGRAGDIINFLPLLRHLAQRDGENPKLMVAKEFSGILDGVSYVHPLVFDRSHTDLDGAVAMANNLGLEPKCVQVNGPIETVASHTYAANGIRAGSCTGFQQEAWRAAGFLDEWPKGHPLVFDKRSPERETALLKSCGLIGKGGRKKPLVLVALDGSSSPFPYVSLCRELLRLGCRDYRVLELPKAERIYDLLALYEQAHCLVATDSAPLQLARARPGLPVLALTNDKPTLWNGSDWFKSWAWCCRYSDFPFRAHDLSHAIQSCRANQPNPFIYVWNAYESNAVADWGRSELPVMRGALGRDSGNTISDEKRVPYLKDCLRMASARASLLDGDNQFICLTRPGLQYMGGPPLNLCYAYRITQNGYGKAFVPITDLFCATREWWKSHMKEIPDYLLGADYEWSEGLRVLFAKHGAKDVTGCCWMEKKK